MSDNQVRDKPVEIEITPEMIQAGAAALAGWENENESYAEAAERIFRAMICASPGSS